MNRKHILIPVDLERLKNSLDALRFLEAMADDLPFHATLLHVIPLNTAPLDRRIERELLAENEAKLRRVAQLCPASSHALTLRLRFGSPHREIVAEARAGSAELIILSPPKISLWPGLFRSRTTEQVVKSAPCSTLVLPRNWTITPQQYRQATRRQNNASFPGPVSNRVVWQ